jgi:CPA2 family monovalent cation:H+ antiporter-2
MESVFLGGMLSMSSTTIIIKAFNDLGVKSQKFTGIVMGTLIVEDIMAILMMVLLSTAAASKEFSGADLVQSVGIMFLFLILCFVVGIFVFPTFLRKARKWMNDETLLILSIGLCFGVVTLGEHFNLSAALGAFVMGSILAGTVESEHIDRLIRSIKDLFGAIFFVSVGMMFKLDSFLENWVLVVGLTMIVLVGRPLFASFGALLSGQSLQTSIRTGFSLAQVGEFAFIIAALGNKIGVLQSFIHPVIIAVSVITTFTTPYFIRLADPFHDFLEARLPDKIKQRIVRHTSGTSTANHESEWKRLLKAYIPRTVIFTVILMGIILLYRSWFLQEMQGIFTKWWGTIVAVAVSLFVMFPFLRGLLLNKGASVSIFSHLWVDKKYSRSGLLTLVLIRTFIAVVAVATLLYITFEFTFLPLILIALAIVGIVLISRASLTRYSAMEKHFMDNLHLKEKNRPIRTALASKLANRDIHLMTVVVSPDSPSAGKSIAESPLYTDTGVVIVKIERGSKEIYLPKAITVIYPHDTLLVLGTNEQLKKYTAELERTVIPEPTQQEITLQTFVIEPDSPLVDQRLEELQLREKYGCWVVGIERGQDQVMNPKGSMALEEGDLIWIVGEKDDIVRIISPDFQ